MKHFQFEINRSIFTGCNDKEVKQVLLINHGWISPTLQRGWGLENRKG